jgi:hypothetical protein
VNELLSRPAEPRYRPRMPQKPQARAKDKKRLTKRLTAWRKKQELAATPPEPPKTTSKS